MTQSDLASNFYKVQHGKNRNNWHELLLASQFDMLPNFDKVVLAKSQSVAT